MARQHVVVVIALAVTVLGVAAGGGALGSVGTEACTTDTTDGATMTTGDSFEVGKTCDSGGGGGGCFLSKSASCGSG